jgi:hypothetical protein
MTAEPWRVRTNKGLKDILQGEDIVKFIKSFMLKESKTKECQNRLQQLQ